MKHPSTRELFEYWNARRGSRPAPERGEIEPGAIRRVLADTFILAVDPPGGHPFRLAGTRLCAAFGRELKGVPFTELWSAGSQKPIRDIMEIVASESLGVIAGAGTLGGDGAVLKVELIALPLAQAGRSNARILGALVPTNTPYWPGVSTLDRLTLGTIRYLGSEIHPSPATPVPAGHTAGARIRGGLVVYDGARSDADVAH
jgi:hypothetical protein